MATKQGDTALLNDPIAKELLQSTIPARFAYLGSDGTPRVVSNMHPPRIDTLVKIKVKPGSSK